MLYYKQQESVRGICIVLVGASMVILHPVMFARTSVGSTDGESTGVGGTVVGSSGVSCVDDGLDGVDGAQGKSPSVGVVCCESL